MKKTFLNGLVILAIACISISCKKEEADPENVTPVVSTKLDGNTIKVTATDEDGTIEKVEFIYGSSVESTDKSAPYLYSPANCGNRKYTIKVYDNDGGITTFVKTFSLPC